ncbi:MAG: endonuclease/exonuclease/phosphatase family protein [Spirochaetales bacterium]|nr:endonuclease/exonuclease/phosphatase family protein [Spirochaetales bacterium]
MKTRGLCIAAIFLLLSAVLGAESLKVVAFPVWSGLKDSGFFTAREYEEPDERAFRLDIMKSGLQALNPDLAMLTGLNGLPKTAEELSEELGYNGMYSVNKGGVRIGVVGLPWNLREGSVLLVREEYDFQPLESKRFSGLFIKNTLSMGVKTAPQIMGGKITLAGREVYVFTVHWIGGPAHPEKDLQDLTKQYADGNLEGDAYIKAVRESVRRSEESLSLVYSTLGFINSLAGEAPVILAGSLNITPDSREMEALSQAGFKDAWEKGSGSGYTLDGQRNLNIRRFYGSDERDRRERLDYVLYRGEGITVRKAELVFDSPTFGVHPSDRFGVYAHFDVQSEE